MERNAVGSFTKLAATTLHGFIKQRKIILMQFILMCTYRWFDINTGPCNLQEHDFTRKEKGKYIFVQAMNASRGKKN
jgi:hypothetical protein